MRDNLYFTDLVIQAIFLICGLGRKGVKGAQPGPVLSWAQRVKIVVGVARGLEY